MADVREREKIAREIEKTSESIRKKHRALITGRIEEGIALDSASKRERKEEEEQEKEEEGEEANEMFVRFTILDKSNDRSHDRAQPITVPTIESLENVFETTKDRFKISCKRRKVERRYELAWARWATTLTTMRCCRSMRKLAKLKSEKKIEKISSERRPLLHTVIVVLSKYAWAVPLKSKGGSETTKESRCPKNLQTDMGKEFYNADVQKILKKHEVNHYSTLKASVVERFNRTLKNDIRKIKYKTIFEKDYTPSWTTEVYNR
ncbi:YMD3 protein, partial [Pseudoatta argentina]